MLEVPASHMRLVTDSDAMRQLTNALQCPSISGETMLDIVTLWLALTYTTETHSYLVEAGLVESFLAKPDIPKPENSDNLIALYQ